MENYSKFIYSGIRYILGDDSGIYINRKNNKGLYNSLVGYLNFTNELNIDWLPGQKEIHNNKVKKSNHKITKVIPIYE